MVEASSIKIGGHTIALTNGNKILFAKSKITKAQLIDYYQQIAPHMLPFMKDHPLSLYRFPNGINGEKFFQKNVPDFFPDWIERIKVTHRTKHASPYDFYAICNNAATLVYLANYVCVPHIWLSKKDKLDYPDRLIFDLDPADKMPFSFVRETALWLKTIVEFLGLTPFAMTTGSRGMHVVIPLKRIHTFDEVRRFARLIAHLATTRDPKKLTIQARKETRGNRLFIDYLRNGYGATSVTPYAVRDKENAPVAMPILWDEVEDAALQSQSYNISNVFKKLARDPDPWHNFTKYAASLAGPQKKLATLMTHRKEASF